MFLSLGMLLAGHGLQLSVLPLRGLDIGFSASQIGLTGSLYFAGFVTGCLTASRLLQKAGAVRAMMTLIAIMSGVLLALNAQGSLWLWLLLRFITGWCIAAIYTACEAWISETTEHASLGRMFYTYVLVTLIGMAVGQSLLVIMPGDSLFSMGSILMLLAIVPIGLYCPEQPMNLKPTRLSLPTLKKLPNTAIFGVGLIGVVTGCVWTLAPMVARNHGLSLEEVGLLMNAILLGGIVFQILLARFADGLDRRVLISMLATAGTISSLSLLLNSEPIFSVMLILSFIFGGCALSLYGASASLGQIETQLSPVETASLLLLIHGLGSVLGPIIAGLSNQYLDLGMYFIAALAFAGILVGSRRKVFPTSENVVPLEIELKQDSTTLGQAA